MWARPRKQRSCAIRMTDCESRWRISVWRGKPCSRWSEKTVGRDCAFQNWREDILVLRGLYCFTTKICPRGSGGSFALLLGSAAARGWAAFHHYRWGWTSMAAGLSIDQFWLAQRPDHLSAYNPKKNTTDRSITGKAAVQEGGNIARTVGHGHNLYGPRCGAIDDEVSTHGP